jgi:hypothetical protein
MCMARRVHGSADVLAITGLVITGISQGRDNFGSEPFTAQKSVSYQMRKSRLTLRLWAQYDGDEWHQVDSDVTISLVPGDLQSVTVSHIRVGNTSRQAVSVSAAPEASDILIASSIASFDLAPATLPLTSTESSDAFILRLNADSGGFAPE